MSRARRRLVLLPLVVLCALLGSALPAQAATPKQVLVLGDSIVAESSNYVGFYLSHDGRAQATVRAVGGTAICDVLPGSGGPWTIDGLLAGKRYDAVVMAFSGNSLTKCMGGRSGQAIIDKYRADAHAAMRTAQQYGVPAVVWVKPPAAGGAYLDSVRSGVGRVYGYLPGTYPTARVIDGGHDVEWGGKFTPWMPCRSWEKTTAQGCVNGGFIRVGADDGVHFYCARRGPTYYGIAPPCDTYSSGSNRYGMNLGATRALIGLP